MLQKQERVGKCSNRSSTVSYGEISESLRTRAFALQTPSSRRFTIKTHPFKSGDLHEYMGRGREDVEDKRPEQG